MLAHCHRKSQRGGSLGSICHLEGWLKLEVAGGVCRSRQDAVGDGGTDPRTRPIPLTPRTLVRCCRGVAELMPEDPGGEGQSL